MLKAALVFLSLSALLVFAEDSVSIRKGTGERSSSLRHSLEEFKSEKRFMGCLPSAGECRYSCPAHSRFVVVEDTEKCADSNWERFACYCLVDVPAE